MDMLSDVYFIIYNRYSSQTITRKAHFSKEQATFSGVEVNEFTKVAVKLISSDSNAKVIIDSCKEEGNPREEIPVDEEVIIMPGSNTEGMLVPGQHIIEIHSHGEIGYAYYTVKSTIFTDETLLSLRKYLDEMLSGLSYDLLKEKMGMQLPHNSTNSTLFQTFQFIDKHRKYIEHNVRGILRNPITNIIGKYKITPYTRKPDAKSFQWQVKKGIEKTSFSPSLPLYKEKHKELTMFNLENQWIKYIINFLLRSLRKLNVSLQIEMDRIDLKVLNLKQQVEENTKQLNKAGISVNTYGYTNSVRSIKKNESNIQKKTLTLEKEKKTYEVNKQYVKNISKSLMLYEETSWLAELPIKKPSRPTQRMFKDHRYKSIYDIYLKLFKIENNNINSNKAGMRFKRTWQLFEYYSVGMVIDILKENGYQWVSGWLADKDNPNHYIGTLPGDTILRFNSPKNDHFIEVAYDADLDRKIINKEYSRYFNEIGRRPDIRMTIYKNDETIYSERAGLIIEVKCRNHHYIINNQIDPDIKEQLKDFKNLDYFNHTAHDRPICKPIKQVVVLYPKQKGKDPVVLDHLYGEEIVYIQIEPGEYGDKKPFGYESLKNRVNDFLSLVKDEKEVYHGLF